ncbi:MAG: hypothetical protein ABIN37_08115 [Burkholderiaceae bacterium]
MSFFKKYNGTNNTRLARLETLIWVLIYGGLLTALVGAYMSREAEGSGDALVLTGILVALAGAALIYVRSRLHEEE